MGGANQKPSVGGVWIFSYYKMRTKGKIKTRSKMLTADCGPEVKCVVPENIHTPTTEGIGNSGGVGGQKPRKIQRRGGVERINYFPEGQLRFIPM